MGQGDNKRNSITGPMRLLSRERSNRIARTNEAINNRSSSVGVAWSNARGDRKVVNIKISNAGGDREALTTTTAVLDGPGRLLITKTGGGGGREVCSKMRNSANWSSAEWGTVAVKNRSWSVGGVRNAVKRAKGAIKTVKTKEAAVR